MSNWDFGYSREPTDPRDPRYPPPPGRAGGPGRPGGPRGRGDAGWPGAEGYPDAEGWPGHGGAPYDPQAAPYPVTYESDDFDGRPTWSTEPQQAGPWRAPRPTSPGRAVPQRAGDRPTAPWQTGPQPAATQRPARAQAVPQQASPQQAGPWPGAPRAAPPPWAPGRPPADQFGGDQYAGGQHGYAGGDRGYVSAQPGYLTGQTGYADGRGGYPGGQRGLPDEEPWLDDPRGSRLDGPWWDPDSWPGWRRWLIPVVVALLAAAIGAALVLLTGMHQGASAAVGAAKQTTQTSATAGRPLSLRDHGLGHGRPSRGTAKRPASRDILLLSVDGVGPGGREAVPRRARLG
jgi:hypothetical protein